MELIHHQPPVLGFCAYSGTGKTTLLTRILPILKAADLRIGMIKHAHHDFDIDNPAKDSYKLRKAGAQQMLITSSRRWALMCENEPECEPMLTEVLMRLNTAELDLILVEGFKHETFPKIELHRATLNHSLIFPQDRNVIALACDEPPEDCPLPILDINNPQEIATFILDYRRNASHLFAK